MVKQRATINSNFNMFRDPIVCKEHREVGYEALVMKRYYRWDVMHCSCQIKKVKTHKSHRNDILMYGWN